MNILKALLFSLIFSIIPIHTYADDNQYSGSLTLLYQGKNITFKNLPTFNDFPAKIEKTHKKAQDIDWSSHQEAWSFRTRLRAGLKSNADYNGHYKLISHGCGSSCQLNWVLNTETGKVLGNFTTTSGTKYHIDSSLITADFIPQNSNWSESYGMINSIRYFAIMNDELVNIKTLDLSTMWKNTPTSP